MNADGMLDREIEFLLGRARNNVHHAQYRRIAMLYEQHAIFPNRNGSVNLMALGGVVVPYHLLLRSNFGNAELMREQNVSIRKHHHIADLALARRVVVA